MEDQEQKFQIGDLVTTNGRDTGRVVAAEFRRAGILEAAGLGNVRMAGELIPRWFYRVRGFTFNEDQWLREETLRFVY